MIITIRRSHTFSCTHENNAKWYGTYWPTYALPAACRPPNEKWASMEYVCGLCVLADLKNEWQIFINQAMACSEHAKLRTKITFLFRIKFHDFHFNSVAHATYANSQKRGGRVRVRMYRDACIHDMDKLSGKIDFRVNCSIINSKLLRVVPATTSASSHFAFFGRHNFYVFVSFYFLFLSFFPFFLRSFFFHFADECRFYATRKGEGEWERGAGGVGKR